MGKIYITRWQSPLGELIIGSIDSAICICDWASRRNRSTVDRRLQRILRAEYTDGTTEIIHLTINQLQEYFAGTRRQLDIPIRTAGTDFQCRVWSELTAIPYGATTGYADIAARIGRPTAVRAVANSIAANPLSILIPCHRVLASTPSTQSALINKRLLTGYAGGLPAKAALLALEAATINGACEKKEKKER